MLMYLFQNVPLLLLLPPVAFELPMDAQMQLLYAMLYPIIVLVIFLAIFLESLSCLVLGLVIKITPLVPHYKSFGSSSIRQR